MNDVNYEYLDITLSGNDATSRLNAYKQFGWEVVDIRESAQASVRLRRALDSERYDEWVRAEEQFDRRKEPQNWVARLLARV
ncbi:hypothetical protein [Lacticaseibacillus songhuajiangensis]|jgi:hypothetical protein|uniref:hypothetical protein n=1 Tax=Lacticaseibacillus songhuajiangensis TaxID=1296539 RepID=UPI000F7A3C67|nr:hypothetical protein [Lacticaseibacillus songhuajiangensis]